jgi:hypothetical protein
MDHSKWGTSDFAMRKTIQPDNPQAAKRIIQLTVPHVDKLELDKIGHHRIEG